MLQTVPINIEYNGHGAKKTILTRGVKRIIDESIRQFFPQKMINQLF